MNTKTMEGLAGAAASVQLTAVPMSAFREAQRKGDTGGMERAMGYASELMEQAETYQEKAREGMKLEAEEARKQEKVAQEKLQEKRKAEKEVQEKRLEESRTDRKEPVDSVEISPEGREYLVSTGGAGAVAAGTAGSMDLPSETVPADPGAAVETGAAAAMTMDVSV